MSLVLNRDDIKKGIGNPNTQAFDADYIGQFYVDTNANELYVSTGKSKDTWQRVQIEGDKMELSSEDLDYIKDQVLNGVDSVVGESILQKPAIQLGITGGVIDVNSDLYVKGDMYLWDASYEDSEISSVDSRWDSDSSQYTVTNNWGFDTSSGPLGKMNLKGRSIIKITLPKNGRLFNGEFVFSGSDKYREETDSYITEPGNTDFDIHYETSYRIVKNNKIIKNGAIGPLVEGKYPKSYTVSFPYSEADYLEVCVNSDFANSLILTLSVPDKTNKVWTQRNWSPTMMISNTDELDAMGENESRTLLLQKSKRQQLLYTSEEPVVPYNGQIIKFNGKDGIKLSLKGIVGGSNGDYFENGKCYEFRIVGDSEANNNKWHVIEEETVPVITKPIMLVGGKNSTGDIIAQSTQTDSTAMLTALGVNNTTIEQLQTVNPINFIGNTELQLHSAYNNQATQDSMWGYSAYTTELRLNAVKILSKEYTDLKSKEISNTVNTINNTLNEKVKEAITNFSSNPDSFFSQLKVHNGDSSGVFSLDVFGNTTQINFTKNTNTDAPVNLELGTREKINELKINADSIIFDGTIKNSNGRQDISLPSLRLTTPGQNFINSQITSPAIDLNNGAIARTNQIVFSGLNDSPMGLFFPRFNSDQAGRYMGNYDYLNIRDGLLRTSAVISSERNYIILDGKRIFFSPTQPTRAEDGDIWIQI